MNKQNELPVGACEGVSESENATAVSKHFYTIVCNEEIAEGIDITFSIWQSRGDIVSWERGIDVDNIDLWNDADIKKNFEDNILGKFITGTNDFVIKNAAIQGAFTAVGAAAKAASIRAGLTTKFRVGDADAMPQWENLADEHIKFRETGGAEGLQMIGKGR